MRAVARAVSPAATPEAATSASAVPQTPIRLVDIEDTYGERQLFPLADGKRPDRLIAAAAMSFSSVSVVGNALRLRAVSLR